MKKNDIIAQKLFETCKLSEFYLNLLKNEDESPMQLAHAYKQKLYEIVERYDRLLDANKQREKLNLDLLDNNSKLKSRNLGLSKTSTPNKSMSALNTPINGQTPISVLTSSSSTNLPPNSNCSSYASTPATTPGYSSNRSTFGTYNRGSSRSIYSQANQQHHYSNKQMQKFAYLYADTSDESDAEQDEVSDYDYKPNLKCQLEYDSYSSGSGKKNEISNSESDEEEEKSVENNNLLNQCNQNIEKSYSNLSKDSGVFGESYHSECSNHLSGIVNKQNITTSDHDQSEDRISDEDNNNTFEENLTSPAPSSSSSNNSCRDETFYPSAESSPKSIEKNTAVELNEPPKSFIWGSVTRLVEEDSSKNIQASDIYSNNLPVRPVKPIKPNFFLKKFNNEQNQQPKSLLKSSLNNSLLKQTNNYRTITKNNNYNVDVDNTNMMSIMIDNDLKNNENSLSSEKSLDSSELNDSLHENQSREAIKTSPFIFNYNSLMNVSMLDNIQATNTNNSEVDMNCSILMFN